MKKIPLLIIGTAALVAGGCATNSAKLSDEAKQAKNERYVYVKTIDSHIPQRVPVGGEVANNEGSSPVGVVTGERARDLLRPRGLNPR